MQHNNQLAILFPGQGSQAPGMGQGLYSQYPEAKKLFEQIDQIIGRPLSKICFEGPSEELKRTINTQPAILGVSVVAWECYRQSGGLEPKYAAGHSLGEFSALYAAGVLSLESVIKLVDKRAQLMENCPPGAMSAILSMKAERIKEICSADKNKIVVVANYNTEEQTVISGEKEAVAEIGAQIKAEGAKVIPLPVGGAFHSPLMAEAAKEFALALDQCQFADAKYPVIQNVNAKAETNGNAIKEILKKQMTSSVMWCHTIKYMSEQGINQFIEIGPGKVLSGMTKRIVKTAQAYNVEDENSLQATMNALSSTNQLLSL